MSENGVINISIEEDGKVSFSTNLSVAELNYYLDHIKYLILSGQAVTATEQDS